jgi:hypothetical protein
VYYFSRRFGNKWEPFYIGETLTLRSRLRQHLDHTQMFCLLTGIPRRGLAEIAMGARYFHFGYLKGKQGKAKACLRVVQKFMIEEALAHKFTLVNRALTKIPKHEVNFNGSRLGRGAFPQTSNVEA